jgi:outer membrane lipoprotein-sorting protein
MVSFHSDLAPILSPLPLTLSLMLVLGPAFPMAAADPDTLLSDWLDAQTNLTTWSADVVQTRTLKSLVQPLTTTGRVWFAAPNLFRWELGDPPQTIAVRQPDRMLVIYPRLNRVEQFPLDGGPAGPWRDALPLIEAGFPRSAADLESRFRILSISPGTDRHEIVLQPVLLSARRLMPRISVFLTADPLALRATELEFADGSSLRNDFTNAVHNPTLDPDLFHPSLDPQWKQVQPGP